MSNRQPIFFTSYADLERHLLAMPRFQDVGPRAAHFALDQIREFSEAIGEPHRDFRSVHVAGTNGKGTVCSILASVYKQAGYKTGLYTSPHLTDVRERFRINGEMISESDMLLFFNTYSEEIASFPLTFFELTTAIAFWWFSREAVDIAVIETGLGGRLDATNIIIPEISVITSVGLDHQQQLGNTVEAVAAEKAGILKPRVPFVIGNLPEPARDVIVRLASMIGSEQVTPIPDNPLATATMEFVSQNPVPFLKENVVLCSSVVHTLGDTLPVDVHSFEAGLKNRSANSGLRGRFERLHPDRNWFFDGAHNPDALNALFRFVSETFPDKEPVCILTLMEDKLTPEVILSLSGRKEVYFYPLHSARSLSFEKMSEVFTDVKLFPQKITDITSLLNKMKSKVVLFTGSFYFYSTVIGWMESHAKDSNE